MPYTDEMYGVRRYGSITENDERPPSAFKKSKSKKNKKKKKYRGLTKENSVV